MSEDDDRKQAVASTRVWKTLKNDTSWIQMVPDQKNSEQEDIREDQAVDSRSASSYVLSTAKKFESEDQPVFEKNVVEKAVGNADTPDNKAAEFNSELLPQTPADTTAQDAEALPPSSCEEAPLEPAPEVASEREADGVPPDQSNMESSSNDTDITEAQSSVLSFEHAATQCETSAVETEADKTIPPENTDGNPDETVATDNETPPPVDPLLTYPPPPDALGKDTENGDPVVMETPAVSHASAGVSAIKDDAFHGNPLATEAALELVADAEQFSPEDVKAAPPSVYMAKQDLCLFCDKIFDGNVKLIMSEPPFKCHPVCLKCGACSKFLGDLLTPIFSHKQRILCDDCFFATL